MSTLLEVESVGKQFRSTSSDTRQWVTALQDVSFHMNQGEVLGIVGESGSGKSTLARLITNLDRPTTGSLTMAGVLVEKHKRLSETVQMVFQDPFGSLNPSHTIGYTISRPMLAHKKIRRGNRERVLALLEMVGLNPAAEFYDKLPHELSGGQRQRVIVAKVLGLNPKLLVLDEPTSMLDVSMGIEIMNMLLDIRRDQRLSMIFITHNLANAWYMSDRIAVMLGGRIVEIGDASNIIQNPLHPYTQLLLKSSPDPRRPTLRNPDTFGTVDELSAETNGGCPFQNRCPFVQPECKIQEVPTYQSADGRSVRCIMKGDDNA